MQASVHDPYELCIVGSGMIGASTAREASKQLKDKLLVIGPSEPSVHDIMDKDIFASYYDEGRITRTIGGSMIWSELANKSISMYSDIERESGLKFYIPVGCLGIATKGSQQMNAYEKTISAFQKDYKVSEKDKRKTFPYLNIPNGLECFFDKRGGVINPRTLVGAQLKIAQNFGATIYDDVVKKISKMENGLFKIETDGKETFISRKVLLATGSFTLMRQLLPEGTQLPITPVTQTVSLLEISKEEAHNLRNMPSVLFQPEDGRPIIDPNKDEITGFYLLPPILYPNGKIYIKLGHFGGYEYPKISRDEIVQWWRSKGDQKAHKILTRAVCSLIKGLKPLSINSDKCLTGMTNDGNLVIDTVYPNFYIALGGNGYAAKSSPEIGRIAANFAVFGTWDTETLQNAFKLSRKSLYETQLSKSKL